MQGDLIDLEPAVRDAVVLTLPTNPLCRPDCPGLCPECGVHFDDLPADHSHEQHRSALGRPAQPVEQQRSRNRGRSQAQDVAQQHPVAPGQLEGDSGRHRGRARSAGRRSCRTPPARSAAPTTAARSSRSEPRGRDASDSRTGRAWPRRSPVPRLRTSSRAPRGSPSTSSAGTMPPTSWLTALCAPARPIRPSDFSSSARSRRRGRCLTPWTWRIGTGSPRWPPRRTAPTSSESPGSERPRRSGTAGPASSRASAPQCSPWHRARPTRSSRPGTPAPPSPRPRSAWDGGPGCGGPRLDEAGHTHRFSAQR